MYAINNLKFFDWVREHSRYFVSEIILWTEQDSPQTSCKHLYNLIDPDETIFLIELGSLWDILKSFRVLLFFDEILLK